MIKKSIIFAILLFLLQSSIGQNKYYDFNRSQIDLLKKAFNSNCKDYNSERPVSKKMVKSDKKIISFLNSVYNKNLTLSEVRASYSKISHKELRFDFSDTKDLGGFKRYESPIYSAGNLRASLLLVVIDDTVLYKKIYFETKRRTSCLNPPTFGISDYDIEYLEENCLQLINFPISIEKWPFISAEKAFFENLDLLKSRGYRGFEVDSTKQLDDLIFFQTFHYGLKRPIIWIKDLYKQNKVDSLTELLYSPNYVVALNAMESLLALNKLRNVSLAGEVLKKMEQIRNADTVIWWASGDVIYHRTYKELNLSENEILEKYRKIQ